MSAIRFHFAEGPVLLVRGPERAMMGSYVTKMASAVGLGSSHLGGTWRDDDAVRDYGPFVGVTDVDDPQAKGLADRLAMSFLGIGFRTNPFSWKGKEIDAWCLALNTALAVGSDPIRLAAKIHATCEIQGYFEGQDRAWLADVIQEGLDQGIFRRSVKYPGRSEDEEPRDVSMGWMDLIAQLRTPHEDDQAVVMSYTVTDGFPDPPKAWRPEITGDERWEQWGELDDWKRFDLALQEVRERPGSRPINPETLGNYRFMHELSLLDLSRRDFAKIERLLECQS